MTCQEQDLFSKISLTSEKDIICLMKRHFLQKMQKISLSSVDAAQKKKRPQSR